MTEFEAVGVLEKAFHPPSESSASRLRYLRKSGSGKRKDEVLGEWSAIERLPLAVRNRRKIDSSGVFGQDSWIKRKEKPSRSTFVDLHRFVRYEVETVAWVGNVAKFQWQSGQYRLAADESRAGFLTAVKNNTRSPSVGQNIKRLQVKS